MSKAALHMCKPWYVTNHVADRISLFRKQMQQPICFVIGYIPARIRDILRSKTPTESDPDPTVYSVCTVTMLNSSGSSASFIR